LCKPAIIKKLLSNLYLVRESSKNAAKDLEKIVGKRSEGEMKSSNN